MSNLFPGVDQLPIIKEFPDPFTFLSGKRVSTPSDWFERRREIAALLLHYQYGHMPPAPGNISALELSSEPVHNGAAVEKRILLSFGPGNALTLHLNLIIPAGKAGPFPVLLRGDLCWKPAPIPEEIVARGYILAEFDRTEAAPDAAGRDAGVYPLYPECDWGALAAWAWAYHRAVDYLVTRDDVDTGRIAITGHSRGGKAALLAGALDDRIALTAPNNSGCGGAGAYRFQGAGSEALANITGMFPYWFHPRLKDFIGHVDRLPLDQHFLLALAAPRPLLITNALGDAWANPEGTQCTYLAAKQVYGFLGAGDKIANHYREGVHEQNAQDWRTLMDFADQQLFQRNSSTAFGGLHFPGDSRAFSWTAPANTGGNPLI